MNNYYFPNSKRPFKFYDDCGEWDYKTKNYKLLFYLKSDFSQVCQKKDVYFKQSKICSVETFMKLPDEKIEHDIIKFVWYKKKHKLDKNFIIIVNVKVSNEINRALFQHIGEQPMKCKKIRVDTVSIQKVKDDINVKNNKIKNTIDINKNN